MRGRLAVFAIILLALPVSAQLSGCFTINPTIPTGGNNFATLLEAVNALTLFGVGGPVAFDLYDDGGPYTEAHPFTTANVSYAPATAVLTLAQWAGASATNRVTFRAAAGESPVFDATGRGMGVFWGGADFVTLEGIEIKNAPFDAISLYSEASHTQVLGAVIRRCNIHDCGGGGVIIYGNSVRPQNTLIENNVFWQLQLTNAGGFNTTARFGYVSGRRHDFSRVVHNTFYVSTGAGSAFCVIGDLASGGTGSHFSEVSGNIIVKTASAARPIYSFPDNPAGVSGVPAIVDAQCYHDPSGGPFSAGSVVAANFAAWQTASGKDAASISADPLLANPAGGDLHLGPGSPCVNLSSLVTGPVDDVDGNPRGIPYDVGADEFLACPAATYEINSLAASLSLDCVLGQPCLPAITTKPQGVATTLCLSSTGLGLGWEAVLAVAPLVPLGGGAITSAFGQILNVNLASPTLLFLNGGASPFFGNPFFPGSVCFVFTTPTTPLSVSIQSLHLDPVHPDGFSLSQGAQLDVL